VDTIFAAPCTQPTTTFQQASGYPPTRRASPPIGQCQIIQLNGKPSPTH